MKSLSMAVLLLFGIATSAQTQRELLADNPVSLIQLIATPDKYDGKVVQIVGFLVLQFEGNAVYMHEIDYKEGITKNGLWVTPNAELRQNSRKYSGHYVLLLGKVDAKHKGHMGMWSGAIKDITAIDLWPPKASTRSK